MKPIEKMPKAVKKTIRYVLADIDDTLTLNGRLPAVVFAAMERLQKAGICMIPITGRPAGWCDHIARMWPVDGIVGENGAFYFCYDVQQRKMRRRYFKSEKQREIDYQKLEKLKEVILKKIPGCRVSADQHYREADLAIDYCEDVPPLSMEDVDRIVRLFEAAGARAKISSIHVNGWFGEYDKLTMTRMLFAEVFKEDMAAVKEDVIFIGDSPNDVPMFQFFPHSVGVANILQFEEKITRKPAWVTLQEGGYGFSEMVDLILAK
ncbi:MAG: HAD-IIB family hydrolase [Desulfobacterales bacterium]|jgi:HAD superfamily hydrolase (TIGR01484 family)|nr:HAD-IIB family hydrolase [Desulfobacterales bacterium]MDH4010988.1 HAD-IIB family hydrolase [Desulfobacterales bacterium]